MTLLRKSEIITANSVNVQVETTLLVILYLLYICWYLFNTTTPRFPLLQAIHGNGETGIEKIDCWRMR
jgi:hypothetical protein